MLDIPTGESLAGRAVAIAEGNALGKGPVVFELPPSGIALVRARAALGDPVFMQLEVRVSMAFSTFECDCAVQLKTCRVTLARCWQVIPWCQCMTLVLQPRHRSRMP